MERYEVANSVLNLNQRRMQFDLSSRRAIHDVGVSSIRRSFLSLISCF